MKPSIIGYVRRVLEGVERLAGMAKTALVLIPKVDSPCKLTHFHPISLCNVVYKLVTETIVNRLKHLLGEVVLPNQENFVPWRQITNNIIICLEIIHSRMVIKVDLEKT